MSESVTFYLNDVLHIVARAQLGISPNEYPMTLRKAHDLYRGLKKLEKDVLKIKQEYFRLEE